ncbi:hypothetical protein MNBD_CHLOROFLEXI01-1806 [hydrothermal vent metagenome]|uniref:Uncharacterized protein n=1 Tax=hydrothermal vent metagenome TaxID=652676 RepID=A0A3B0UX17_9ZZZZ
MGDQLQTAVSNTNAATVKQISLPLPTNDRLALLTLLLHRYSSGATITLWLDGQSVEIAVDGAKPFAHLVAQLDKLDDSGTAVVEIRAQQGLPILASSLEGRLPTTFSQPLLTMPLGENVLHYDSALFDVATTERLVAHLQTLQ